MFTLFEAIEKGGFVMYILCAFSVYSIAVAIYKLLQFYRAGLLFGHDAEQASAHILEGECEKALDVISHRHPASEALRALHHGKGAEHAAALGNKAFRHIDSHIRALEVIAAVAPLLGLLGTVIGMVKAFSGISAGGSNVDPGMLAGGIWEALLTTIAGLAVAIPAMIITHFLQSRSERARAQTEEIALLILSLNQQKKQADISLSSVKAVESKSTDSKRAKEKIISADTLNADKKSKPTTDDK